MTSDCAFADFGRADFGRDASLMVEAIAKISSDENALTRLFLSPEHKMAADLVARWMQDRGLSVTRDALGTVKGQLKQDKSKGVNRRRKLLIGSHIDTVINAGKFDGTLGVICAILALDDLKKREVNLPFDVEVLAFGDEEGVRFPTTLSSSSAVAGVLKPDDLEATDKDGVSVKTALESFGGAPELAMECSEDPELIAGYIELHIEQGPVLQAKNTALGVVTSIAGASRFHITITGQAGHAGTVPMALRHDALSAASELIGVIESVALSGLNDKLVATVGELHVSPGAVNVIPASVRMTLDIRAERDEPRLEAIAAIKEQAARISKRRDCAYEFTQFHEVSTCPCSPLMREAAQEALISLNIEPLALMSGAGHDGQAMAHLTEIGMMFIRCRDGVSHSPLEHVEEDDMDTAVKALVRWIEILAQKERKSG